jgi:phospholipase C
MSKLLFEHFIVLMLENRSFDHLFGYLGIGDGLSRGTATNYLKPTDKKSGTFSSRAGGDYTAIGQGPSHSLKETNMQLFGVTKPTAAVAAKTPSLNGFVASFKTALTYDLKRSPTTSELQQVMNCFDPVQLPVLSTLAKNFVLCDRWFADVPGPTMPNRAFVHAATSQGYTHHGGALIQIGSCHQQQTLQRQDPPEQRDQRRSHARPVLVKSDDQQSGEQQQSACKPHERIAFEEVRCERAQPRCAQHDDAGDDDQPRPDHPREGAGPGL